MEYDKFVCSQCLEDVALQNFIRNNATTKICSYCDTQYPTKKCTSVEEVAKYIETCLLTEYEDPVEHVPYETKEGGYQAVVHDAYEILDSIEPIHSLGGNLFDDLVSIIGDSLWTKDYFDPCTTLPKRTAEAVKSSPLPPLKKRKSLSDALSGY